VGVVTADDINFFVESEAALGMRRRWGRRRVNCVSRVEGGGGRGERLLKREGDEDDLEVSVNGRLFDVFDDIFDIFIELEGVFDKHNTVCSVNSVNSTCIAVGRDFISPGGGRMSFYCSVYTLFAIISNY
jgi:hypothetical protein